MTSRQTLAAGTTQWTRHDVSKSGTRDGSLRSVLTLCGILLAAAWLRLHGLGGHGLWQDEAYSFVFATMPAGKFWKLMWSREGNMLLYYVLLRGWVHVGVSEFMLRLPSVIFAVASVAMIYELGKQLFSKTTGLLAAALLSVHMLDIFSSQNARAYTLAVLLLLASSLAFVALVRHPNNKVRRLLYPLVGALALYAQLLTVFVIAAQWLSLDRTRLHNIGWKRWLGVLGTFFLAALPMEAFALLKNKGQLNWIPPLSSHSVLEGMYALTGYGGLSLLGLYVVLIVIAVAGAVRKGSCEGAFAVRLLLLWLLFPITVMLLYSLHKPLFYSRFLILCVPAATLLAAEGIASLRHALDLRRWLWLPAIVAVVALSLRADWNYYRNPMWPDWEAAARLVLSKVQPDDAICFSGNGAEVFLYYMQREQQIPWSKLPTSYYSQGIRCLGETPEQLAQASGENRRVWLFKTDGTEEQYQRILGLLIPHFGPPAAQGSFSSPPGRIVVYLLLAKSTPAGGSGTAHTGKGVRPRIE